MEGNALVLVRDIITYVINPAVRLLFAAAFVLFLWGLFIFLYSLDSVAKKDGERNRRREGMNHMKWGIIGLFIMVSVQGIIVLINDTFGFRTNGPVPSGEQQEQQNPFFRDDYNLD
jgi:membrane protease YdiL (CAAX protease family)